MSVKYKIVMAAGNNIHTVLERLEDQINDKAKRFGYKMDPKPDSIGISYEDRGPAFERAYHARAIMYKEED